MEILLSVTYALLFLILIRVLPFFKLDGIHKNALPIVFLLKILAGVVLYIIYTRFYTDRQTADIFRYFDDSKVMYGALFEKPVDFFKMMTGVGNDSPEFARYYDTMNNWYRVYESNIYNDSHTIIRLNALFRIFSFGYYQVHTVFMCFLSLAGLTGIYRFFAKTLVGKRPFLFMAVFLLPSVLFWGSGVLKEGLLFFGLGMFLWHIEMVLSKRKIVLSALILVLSLTLLIYTKFYIMLVMLPLVLAYIWCRFTGNRLSLLKYASVLIICLIAGLNFHYLFPNYDFVRILIQKQHDFINLAKDVQSGSLINMEPLDPGFWSLLLHTPEALYNTIFRPWFFESKSPVILLAGLENLLLLLMIVTAIVFFKPRKEHNSLLWLSLFFFLGIFVLTGLTTPVMGAIVRYKVPALPFFAVFLVILMNTEKIQLRLQKFKMFRKMEK